MRVNETKLRSFYKALSFRAIEIGVDTGLLWFAFTNIEKIMRITRLTYATTALVLACIMEAICFGLHYGFERLWNKTDFGRDIIQGEK